MWFHIIWIFWKIGWHADTTPMYRAFATFFKGDTGDTRLTHFFRVRHICTAYMSSVAPHGIASSVAAFAIFSYAWSGKTESETLNSLENSTLRARLFVLRGRLFVQFSREFTSFSCSACNLSPLTSYLSPLTSHLTPHTSHLLPLTSKKCVSLVSPVSPLKKVANALYIGVVSACQPIIHFFLVMWFFRVFSHYY